MRRLGRSFWRARKRFTHGSGACINGRKQLVLVFLKSRCYLNAFSENLNTKCVLAEFNVGITGVTGVTAIIARFMELVTGITSPHLYTNFY